MDTIGSRIRALREGLGKTRKEMAAAVGIAGSTLSDLEAGRSQTTTALHRIADYLGVRVEWLETGKGERLPTSQLMLRQSQPMRPDPAILIETQKFLEAAFSSLGKEFSMEADADIFARVYEWVAVDDRPVEQRNLVDFAKWRSSRDEAATGGKDEQDRHTVEPAGRSNRRSAR